MATALQLTDRAYRYRANAAMPAGEKRCALCGNPGRVEVGHVDGHEENTAPENLFWTCRPCNVKSGNHMRKHGMGRLTRQYNPSGGAKNLAQWLTAVTSMKGENSAMSVHDAVAVIHATPASKRSEFARQIWAARRSKNPDWSFLGLSSAPPAPHVRHYIEDGDTWAESNTPQYYGVRVRSNVTYEDKGGTSGFYVSDKSPHAVRLELEGKMHHNADWDVVVTQHRAKKEEKMVKREFERNPGFLPKSLFDRYTIRDKTEGADLQTNIQTLAGAKHAVKKFGKKHPCSALAIVSDKFGEVESYKPANGRELVIDQDNSKDYKKRATEEAKKNVRYELYIGGVLHDTYDTRKEAESFAKDKRVTDGKATKIKEVVGNPAKGESNYAAVLATAVKRKFGPTADISKIIEASHTDYHRKARTGEYTGEYTRRVAQAAIDSGLTQQEIMRLTNTRHGVINPLGKFKVTYRGKSFEVLAASKADAERQVAAIWKGKAVVNPKGSKPKKQRIPWDDGYHMTQYFANDGDGNGWYLIGYDGVRRNLPRKGEGYEAFKELVRKRNPDDTTAAEALYEAFHGVPSTGETIYEEVHEVPDAFAELGQLIELKVATIHGKDITIAAPDPEGGDLSSVVKLASSPDGRQLYFIGGDQDIDLEAIGFTESEERHRMLIGVLYELTYRTKKAFHKLKTTDYYHQLGEDTKNQPMLVYNPYSERMGVVGGDYPVRPEGIVN